MVGRSKPSKKIEPKPSMDFNTAEVTFLKAKNLELAKALADSKVGYTQMVEERDILQRELFSMNVRCTKLENYIKNIQTSSKSLMNSVVTSSNYATDIIQFAHNALRRDIHEDNSQAAIRNSLINGSPHTPASTHRTQAVKPMIGGHVILRPTINLRRVNEIPMEEIQRLQAGGSAQITNRNSLENNASNSNQAQDNIATNVRMFAGRPGQPILQTFRNITEDEYTDETSEISDPPSVTNDRLDTVQEEHEDDLTSQNHLTLLGNGNSPSLNLSGRNSQVPLLSGVFRDVRVYLSPMQDVAQYLNPLEQVSTERGSGNTNRARTSFLRPSRTNGTGSSGSGRNGRLAATSTSVNASSPSIENSFSATLDNSLLSSTRIGTPRNMHTTLTKPEDLNWLNGSNNSRGSRTSHYKQIPGFRRLKRLSPQTPSSPRLSNLNNSSRISNIVDDPLEGPSNMLDSVDEETKNKINTLSGEVVKPASSPAETVVRRRGRRSSAETAKKSLYVTKRTAIEKRKSTVVSTKLPKVLIKRLSLNKSNSENSPRRSRKSLNNSNKSLNNSKKSLNNSKKSLNISNNNTTASSSASTLSSSSVVLPKTKMSSKRSPLAETNNTSSCTPKKRGRPKRGAAQTSLKEPSLRKKMRRSK